MYKSITYFKLQGNEQDTNIEVMEDRNITTDLTGNPLEINLSGEVSLLALEEDVWVEEESTHFPMSIKTARYQSVFT